MKLLLDTHIWLWSRGDARLIGKRVWAELEDEANELWLSPISTWEALILHRKGKIVLHADPIQWMKQMVHGFHEAPLTHEIVATAEGLQLAHADPADRFLAATAKVLELTLVTADRKLLGLGDIATLANR
ncbi:MAG TPA: type II toxin-antitoxin system VapC family toxin [Terriglobales bacterium]|nr:type II toxin-antitoxin system VapC family toxin [Terriglobales bacterium]